MLLLPGATIHRAETVIAEISQSLEAAPEGNEIQMPTVSYGIAAIHPADTVESAITSADVALYRAKSLGRNRAVSGDEDARTSLV